MKTEDFRMNKKIFSISIGAIALSVASVMVASLVTHHNLKTVNAEECQHEHVEHYAAQSLVVEHWACCACHHAWADEARTIEISLNTTNNREKIDVSGYYYKAEWTDGTALAYYDATYRFMFRHDLTGKINLSNYCLETYGPIISDFLAKSVTVAFTNKTDDTLSFAIHQRAWGPAFKVYSFAPNESGIAVLPVSFFNAQNSGGNYGFSFLFNRTSDTPLNGYFEVSSPLIEQYDPQVLNQYDAQLGALVDPERDFTTNNYVEDFMDNYAVVKEANDYVNGDTSKYENGAVITKYLNGVLFDANNLMSGWDYNPDKITSSEVISLGSAKYNRFNVATTNQFSVIANEDFPVKPSEAFSSFVFRIYNPTANNAVVQVRSRYDTEWGDAPRVNLLPNTWNTLVVSTSNFYVQASKLALIIEGSDLAGAWMIGSAVANIYGDEVVHGNDVQNVTTSSSGWNSQPSGVYDDHSVYKVSLTGQAGEIMAFEKTVIGLDADKFDHVEVKVYSTLGTQVRCNTRGEGNDSWYNLGLADNEEWTTFNIPVSEWNNSSNRTRYFSFQAADGVSTYSGTLYVTFSVAIAK